jgi:hypothetical protein
MRGDIRLASRGAGGELAHVHRDTVVDAICGRRFSLHDRSLPAKTLAEHARLECGGIRQASDVAGLAIAKIERGLRGSGAALVSMRPDQITVSFRHRLAGARGDAACQQNDRNNDCPAHGSHPLPSD